MQYPDAIELPREDSDPAAPDPACDIAALRTENARLHRLMLEMGERMYAMSQALSRVAERREMRGRDN